MSLNNVLISPANKLQYYTKKGLFNRKPLNFTNLILPNSYEGSYSFQFNDKKISKFFLFKKGLTLKNINIKYKIPPSSAKENTTKALSKEKKLLKSNSEYKNGFENYLFKMNDFKRKKNNSFCSSNSNNKSTSNSKNGAYSKRNINLKNMKSFYSTRNINCIGNSVELNQKNKNNNNEQRINKQNKKLTINKSYIIKNKSTFIPKIKSKINLGIYVNQLKKQKYSSSKHRIIHNKIYEKNKTYENIKNNNVNKENINDANIKNINDINNIKDKLFYKPKKNYNTSNSKKKINLPISINTNQDEFFREIKYKKCYIRNNKNEMNIPYNKKNKLIKENSFYNFKLNNLKFKKQRRIIINSITKEDANSFVEAETSKKNNSMYSLDLISKTNINSYSNAFSDLNVVSNENNFEFKKNDNFNHGVEMSHFRIVKIIQENKKYIGKS